MGLEIERKFVVETLPGEVLEWPSEPIEQGYLAIDSEAEVRLRRRGDRWWETVKRGTGAVREELEVELDRRQFEALWPATGGRRVEKRRFTGKVGDWLLEVDVFGGTLTGLVVVEVEFPDRAAAGRFVPPRWFGPEVTGDPRYANRNLAVRGLRPERHAGG